MDGSVFDRIAKNLAEHAPRRETLRALVGGSLIVAAASLDVEQVSGKKKKRKERKLGQTCGGKKKCSKKQGPVVCQEFGSFNCVGVDLTGKRCCGLEGTICDPDFGVSPEPMPVDSVGNCSCCEPLYCGKQVDGSFRCQVEET